MLDPRQVVSEFNYLWEHGNLDAAMTLVTDDCVFTVHVSEDLVKHAGQWVGADQIRLALTMARRHYYYVLYRPVIMGTCLCASVRFNMMHTETVDIHTSRQ
jgi:hypothetical protein